MRHGSVWVVPLTWFCACGGGAPAGSISTPQAAAADPHAAYAPLDVGAGFRSWTKVNTEAFASPTHGKRFVNIYVNEVGLASYTGDAPFPVGTVIVKESFESRAGKPTDTAGPVFVMEKRSAGFAPDREDWYYALHWAEVPPEWQGRMGGNSRVYWRSPSSRVDYCWQCHENYDREVGLPPVAFRAWKR